MASMGGGHLTATQLVSRIREGKLLNKALVDICKVEGLRTGGNKADLQTRLVNHSEATERQGDTARLERLSRMILDPTTIQNFLPQQRLRDSPYSSSPSAPSPAAPRSMGSYGAPPPFVHGGSGNFVTFKPSPFYEIRAQIGNMKTLEIMKEHRNTASIAVRTSDNALMNNIPADPSLRILVFCAADGQSNPRDVTFPHNSEIKVNGGEFKANLRGLKNKPGSTRPVDITDALRLKPPQYSNSVDLTYALSEKVEKPSPKKYFFSINIVKMMPVADLVKRLAAGKRISRETVVREMVAKAEDPDIVATSSVLSLKCPLSTLRISLPCRSSNCRHNQCFDATSYLQLQEQGPTWLCPICNNPAPFRDLAVDEYVKDILAKTSKGTDQVTIEPNGVWSNNEKSASPMNGGNYSSDDDLIEIKDTRVTALKHVGTPVPSIRLAGTPGTASREASDSLPAPARSSASAKRPASAVIDLTLSDDDDDEEPVRPAKRQFTSFNTPPSMFAPPRSNGFSR